MQPKRALELTCTSINGCPGGPSDMRREDVPNSQVGYSLESFLLAISHCQLRPVVAHEQAYDQSEIPQALEATANKLPSDPGYVSSERAGDHAIPIFTFSSPLRL